MTSAGLEVFAVENVTQMSAGWPTAWRTEHSSQNEALAQLHLLVRTHTD